MDARKLLDELVEKSADKYQTYAYATGVLCVTVLGLLEYLAPHHKAQVLRELKEIRDNL